MFALLIGYTGPGAGLTMLGSLLAVVALILLALLAPVVFGIRLLMKLFVRPKSENDLGLVASGESSTYAEKSVLVKADGKLS